MNEHVERMLADTYERGMGGLSNFYYCYLSANLLTATLAIRMQAAWDDKDVWFYCPLLDKEWKGVAGKTDFRPDLWEAISTAVSVPKPFADDNIQAPYGRTNAYLTNVSLKNTFSINGAWWLPMPLTAERHVLSCSFSGEH